PLLLPGSTASSHTRTCSFSKVMRLPIGPKMSSLFGCSCNIGRLHLTPTRTSLSRFLDTADLAVQRLPHPVRDAGGRRQDCVLENGGGRPPDVRRGDAHPPTP